MNCAGVPVEDKRRGDLAAHVAGFADAGDDDPALQDAERFDRARKGLVQACAQGDKRLRFGR